MVFDRERMDTSGAGGWDEGLVGGCFGGKYEVVSEGEDTERDFNNRPFKSPREKWGGGGGKGAGF